MSDRPCPTEAELLGFVDSDLTPEALNRVASHLASCTVCDRQVVALKELVSDLAAPLPQDSLVISEHVTAVMGRLDAPAAPQSRPHWALWGGALAAAAALVLVFRFTAGEAPPGEFTARGGTLEPSLSRDIGVQLYAHETSFKPLSPGSRVSPQTRFTAGLRNLTDRAAYLLLFAVDSAGVVHWIAPQFTDPHSDPEAEHLAPAPDERLLSTAVVFEDLASGPLRVVALITTDRARVSEIEKLSPADLSGERLISRFPRAELRQIQLEVSR